MSRLFAGEGPAEVLQWAEFDRRNGVNATDEQALAGHLAEALADLDLLRKNAEDIAEIKKTHEGEIEHDYKCGLSDTQRGEGHTCESARSDDCLSCQVVTAKRALDCGRPEDARVSGEGECRDTYGACAACRRADAYRDAEIERVATQTEYEATIANLEATQSVATVPLGVAARTVEIARLHDALDCEAERNDASVCKFRDVPQKSICAECSIHGLGLLADAKIAELRAMLVGVEHERDVLHGERDRLILAADAPKPKPAPVVRGAKPGQAAIDFGTAPAAPTVAKKRVRKARLHLLPPGAS